TTVFVFRYDGTSPTNPTQAVETQSVQSGVWQKDVSDPSFTWTAATDTHSGVAGYDVYFGPTLEPNPTPTVTPTPSGSDFVDKPEYDPAGVSSGKYVLIIRTVDQVGNLSAWVKLFDFWYDGDNPPTPGNLTTADPATDSTPTFTWDAVTDAHSGLDVYQIYWGTDGACGTKNQPDTTSASFTAPEITSTGVPYLLCVRARDRAGNLSDWAQTTFTYTP
ncbi:MAG: fibronectin type III domain-containing protein, partial [Anaerolineaceae bacterium]